MIFKQLRRPVVLAVTLPMILLTDTQQSRWATTADKTAQALIEMERQWSAVCATRDTSVLERILADDFLGTYSNGERFTKAQDIENVAKGPKDKYVSGRLDEVQVHFFGDDLAIVYGVTTCVKRTPDGKGEPERRAWTDTWLKRNGRWQVVAGQDTNY